MEHFTTLLLPSHPVDLTEKEKVGEKGLDSCPQVHYPELLKILRHDTGSRGNLAGQRAKGVVQQRNSLPPFSQHFFTRRDRNDAGLSAEATNKSPVHYFVST